MTPIAQPVPTAPSGQRARVANTYAGAGVLALAWLLFIVYGSLVPLEFRALSLQQAWDRFLQLPWLALSAGQRADWVANGLLYLPAGALLCLVLMRRGSRPAARTAAMLAATALGCVLAAGVEFVQVFFPQRTMSLNDLVAECLGSAGGAAAAAFWLHRRWPAAGWWRHPNLRSAHWAPGYAVLLLAVSMFPFDFVLGADEWAERLAAPTVAWWLANDPEWSTALRWLARTVLEALSVAPLAWWLARPGELRAVAALRGGLIGLCLGVLIEGAQLLVMSATSQGFSVLTRGVGLGLAMAFVPVLARHAPATLRERIGKAAAWLALPYALLVLALSGWFGKGWRSPDEVWQTWEQLRFQPFYYHYFVSEVRAMASLLGIAALYAPVGLMLWARGRGPLAAAVLAFGGCVLVEAGKLFAAGTRPDPTNVWVAAAAAAAVAALLGQLMAPSSGVESSGAAVATPAVSPAATGAWAGTAALAVAALAVLALSSPWVWPAATVAVLALAAWATWRQPAAALGGAVLATIALDPRPWAGLRFFDEFDALLAVLLAAGAWSTRRHARLPSAAPDRPLRLWLAVFVLAMGLGAGRALLQWWDSGAPAWAEPLGPMRTWWALKSVAWALALVALLKAQLDRGLPALPWMAAGAGAGLLATALAIGWERQAFSPALGAGALRPAGLLADMGLGGVANEATLLLAWALVAAAAVGTAGRLRQGLAGLAPLLGAWAVAMTFTRTAYVGLVLAAVLLAAGVALRRRQPSTVSAGSGGTRGHGLLAARRAGLAALVLATAGASWWALQGLGGDALQARLQTSGADLGQRETHLREAWARHDGRWFTALWGMGWQRFPAATYWDSLPDQRVSVLSIDTTTRPPALVLGPGRATYLDQMLVDPAPGSQLSLELTWRRESTAPGAAGLQVMLCRKWLLNVGTCLPHRLQAQNAAPGAWQQDRWQVALPSRELLAGPWLVTLFIDGAAPVAVQRLRIEDGGGQPLLRNEGFQTGLRHWHMTADDHLAWHLKSMPVALAWERGLLGVLAFAGLCGLVALRAGRSLVHGGSPWALAAWPALGGLFAIGALDMPFDSPRYQLLWLVVMAGLALVCRPKPARQPPAA